MADPLIPEQQGANTPASGSYGEKADLNRLKAALPEGAVGNPPSGGAPQLPPVQPTAEPQPRPKGRPTTGAAVPPNIPSVLLHPGTPGGSSAAPMISPFDPSGGSPQVTNPQQGRLLILDQLANSPDVSPETREWAQTVLDILVAGTKQS